MSKHTKSGRRARFRRYQARVAFEARRDFAHREVAAGRAVFFNARAAFGVWS